MLTYTIKLRLRVGFPRNESVKSNGWQFQPDNAGDFQKACARLSRFVENVLRFFQSAGRAISTRRNCPFIREGGIRASDRQLLRLAL